VCLPGLLEPHEVIEEKVRAEAKSGNEFAELELTLGRVDLHQVLNHTNGAKETQNLNQSSGIMVRW
jgi:hypothetical protein